MPPIDHPTYQTEAERQAQHQQNAITISEKTLRYTMRTIGEPPSPNGYPLYIALHGGGGCPSFVNDYSWQGMMSPRGWLGSVQNGIFVAPRGISDTWNLHFQAETYALLERLIENMVQFSQVDPDRVYLLGSSAGGDGVYQLAPRLADRLAAANMSAGHPNGAQFDNLIAMPICLQVGEEDVAYNRHRATAEYARKLRALKINSTAGNNEYQHAVFVHKACGHSIPDQDSSNKCYPVLASPTDWLTMESDAGYDSAVEDINPNAISWVSQFTRQALPKRIVWDLKTRAQRTSKGLWYWLDIGNETATSLGIDTVIVELDVPRNAIIIENARTKLRILLNDQMLDLDRSVHVFVGGQHMETKVSRSEELKAATLAQRNDPRWVFSAAIDVVEDSNNWAVIH